MNPYQDFPPYPYFISVLQNNPKDAMLYMLLWKAREESNQVICNKKIIQNLFLMSPTLFKNKLISLNAQGLLSVDESPNMYVISLMDISEEEWGEDFS